MMLMLQRLATVSLKDAYAVDGGCQPAACAWASVQPTSMVTTWLRHWPSHEPLVIGGPGTVNVHAL